MAEDCAWVLQRRPYGDTRMLLECLCREHGRMAFVTRDMPRQRQVLEPLRPLWLCWRGRGDLYTLVRSEEEGPVLRLNGDALAAMWYLNELILRLCLREDPQPQLYALYSATLKAIAQQPTDLARWLRHFEIELLTLLGHAPPFDCDAQGAPLDAGRCYHYCAQYGALEHPQHGTQSVLGHTLQAIVARHFECFEVRRMARHLLRAHIDQLLDGRPLRSRQWLHAMRRHTTAEKMAHGLCNT